jgi:hypothetical protein
MLAGASLAFFAARADAQVPPPAPVPVPVPVPAALQPLQDPPYEPSQHGGLQYGVWVRATRGTVRRSTGMMATGISFILLGATLMGFGTGVYATGDHCAPPSPCGPMPASTTGMALLGAGLVGIGIGIPLTVLGASDVPRAEAGGRASSPRLAFSPGLRGGGLTLHF